MARGFRAIAAGTAQLRMATFVAGRRAWITLKCLKSKVIPQQAMGGLGDGAGRRRHAADGRALMTPSILLITLGLQL